MRKVSDIDKCIKKAINNDLDIVFSISKSSKNPFFNIVTIKKNKLKLAVKTKKIITRRQEAPKCFDLTTVCYVFKPEYILKNKKNLYSGKTGYVEIPKNRALDIDDKFDYHLVKKLSKNKWKNLKF